MATLQPYKKYNAISYDYATELPDGWQLLPNIAIFQERKERGTENEENLTISAIRGIVKSTDYENRKDRTSDDKSQYLLVKEGDLAYNTMLMWDGAVGHSSFRGIVSPAYTVLKAKLKINPKFFHYQMRTEFYKNYSRRFSYGIVNARLRLYYVHFKRMYSIVPPLEVQNSIVAYLDKKNSEIDKFIRNKERLLELLEEEKKAIVYDECKEYFKTHRKKVKFVVRICNGLEQKSVEDINGQYPIYGSGGIIGYANKFLHNKTSVLLGRKGTIDKPIYVTEPFWSIDTAFYTIINERKIIPKYFFFATSFINFDEYKYGSAIPSMTQGMLNNIEIPLPNLDKQKELVEVIEVQLEKLNLAISKAQKEISAIKEYREALITDLVTGKRSLNCDLE
jgi:type I restriction enzyme S subunit